MYNLDGVSCPSISGWSSFARHGMINDLSMTWALISFILTLSTLTTTVKTIQSNFCRKVVGPLNPWQTWLFVIDDTLCTLITFLWMDFVFFPIFGNDEPWQERRCPSVGSLDFLFTYMYVGIQLLIVYGRLAVMITKACFGQRNIQKVLKDWRKRKPANVWWPGWWGWQPEGKLQYIGQLVLPPDIIWDQGKSQDKESKVEGIQVLTFFIFS